MSVQKNILGGLKMMKQKKYNLSLECLYKHDNNILTKSRFLDTCVYHGTKSIKECILEAVKEIFTVSDLAFHSVFDIHFTDYVNYLYAKVEE